MGKGSRGILEACEKNVGLDLFSSLQLHSFQHSSIELSLQSFIHLLYQSLFLQTYDLPLI